MRIVVGRGYSDFSDFLLLMTWGGVEQDRDRTGEGGQCGGQGVGPARVGIGG